MAARDAARRLSKPLWIFPGADAACRDVLLGRLDPAAWRARMRDGMDAAFANVQKDMLGSNLWQRVVQPAFQPFAGKFPGASWAAIHERLSDAVLEDARVVFDAEIAAVLDEVATRLPTIASGDDAALEQAVTRLEEAPLSSRKLAAAVVHTPALKAALTSLNSAPPPVPQEPPPPPPSGPTPIERLGAMIGVLGRLAAAVASRPPTPPEPEPELIRKQDGPVLSLGTPQGPDPDLDRYPPTRGPVLAWVRLGDELLVVGATSGGGFLARGGPGTAWAVQDETEVALLCVAVHEEGVLVGTAEGEVIVYDLDLEPIDGASVPPVGPAGELVREGVRIRLDGSSIRAVHAGWVAGTQDGRVLRLRS